MKDRRKKIQLILILGDIFILFSVYIKFYLYYAVVYLKKDTIFLDILYLIILLSVSYLTLFRYYKFKRFYSHQRVISLANDIKTILKGMFGQFITFLLLIFLSKDFYLAPGLISLSFVITIIFLFCFRMLIRKYQLNLRKRGYDLDNIILIGDIKLTKIIRNKIISDYRYGFTIIQRFSNDILVKKSNVLEHYIVDKDIKEIILTNPSETLDLLLKFNSIINKYNVQVYVIPDIFDIVASVSIPYKIEDITLLEIIDTPQKGIGLLFKRLFDIIASLTGIILISPLLIIVAIFIIIDTPGKIIYSQIRIGKKGKKFKFYKFRSMIEGADKMLDALKDYNEAEGPIFKMKNDPRITTFGKFIRKFSIDELPQLFNVLKGDMSLVGPRPPIPEEVKNYAEWQKRRFSVLPGITGLWQIRGRSNLAFKEMIKLDIYYVENWTFGLDIYILLKTIPVVLSARGSY